jgi:hypothetical protein
VREKAMVEGLSSDDGQSATTWCWVCSIVRSGLPVASRYPDCSCWHYCYLLNEPSGCSSLYS